MPRRDLVAPLSIETPLWAWLGPLTAVAVAAFVACCLDLDGTRRERAGGYRRRDGERAVERRAGALARERDGARGRVDAQLPDRGVLERRHGHARADLDLHEVRILRALDEDAQRL